MIEATALMIWRDDKNLYQCEACGFHYISEETAKECEEWCTEHQSCNLEIIKDSIEERKMKEEV